jgi:MFS family permease
MSHRRAAIMLAIPAFALAGIGTALVPAGMAVLNVTVLGAVLQCLSIVATAGVGLVLALRRPENRIGWLFGWFALVNAANFAAAGYASVVVAGLVALPGAEWAAWFGNWSDRSATGFLLLLFLLFPSGRLVSPRWRPALLLPPVVALGFAARAFVPGPMDLLGLPDPLGLAWVPVDVDQGNLGGLPLIVGTIVAFAELVRRYRTAGGAEREQIKWLAIPVVALLTALTATAVTISLGVDRLPPVNAIVGILYAIAGLLLPVAMGIAVLRYRLYDIDILINRALVYGATTVGIAAAFFGGIVVLEAAIRPFTSGSELAVAGSTLLCFGLFQPLRRRIQAAVDRRFYRSRYDAALTVDIFSATLRDEVDLDAVRADLVDAVTQTVQPAHASVWLR